ncbi:FAD-dependent oxidoreductase [Escherichia coli]
MVKRRGIARARTEYHRARRHFCAVQRHCSYREVTAAMAKIFQARGGEIIYNAEVSALSEHKNGVVVRTRQGGECGASTLISCSGLMAVRLVKMLGLGPGLISPVPWRVFPPCAGA